MKKLPIFILFIFLIASPAFTAPPNKQERKSVVDTISKAVIEEGVKVAENMETLLFLSSPQSKSLISYVDISIKDGHLILYIKKLMLTVAKSEQTNVYKSIQKIWKDTKYVSEQGWSGELKVVYIDNYGKQKTIADLK